MSAPADTLPCIERGQRKKSSSDCSTCWTDPAWAAGAGAASLCISPQRCRQVWEPADKQDQDWCTFHCCTCHWNTCHWITHSSACHCRMCHCKSCHWSTCHCSAGHCRMCYAHLVHRQLPHVLLHPGGGQPRRRPAVPLAHGLHWPLLPLSLKVYIRSQANVSVVTTNTCHLSLLIILRLTFKCLQSIPCLLWGRIRPSPHNLHELMSSL